MPPQIIQSQRPNPLTGSREAVVVATKDRHGAPLRNVCWIDTGFIGVDPIPLADVEHFYKKEYRQEYKGSFSPQKRHVLRAGRVARERLERILRWFPALRERSLRSLDAGASSGEFVFLMRESGHEAFGVEAHEGYAAHAKDVLGLRVTNAVFSELETEGAPFDLITMFHVLEHLEHPVTELARLAATLSNAGVFVIEVPNILHRGMKFSHKWHLGHLNGFSARTLEATASRAGLVPLVCSEIDGGGNLLGVFQKGAPATARQIVEKLSGATPELDQLRANTAWDYYLRLSTWRRLGARLVKQVEERETSARYRDAAGILHAVFACRA
jgi:2-polyprenyl-3-methyl-5-hydroxy-6-metoxy-1,4-benzoquinol methylase